jgi:hypothetical protein
VRPGSPTVSSSLSSTFSTSSAQTTTTSSLPSFRAHHAVTATISTDTHSPYGTSRDRDRDSSADKRSFLPKPQIHIANILPASLNGETAGVTLQGFGPEGKNVSLDRKCLVALNWPVQT